MNTRQSPRSARLAPRPGWRGDWHTVITTYGSDTATANTEFSRDGVARTRRQGQTWIRMMEGWRVVAAQVSLIG